MPRPARQLYFFLQQQVTLRYIKGQDNILTDVLSRTRVVAMSSTGSH